MSRRPALHARGVATGADRDSCVIWRARTARSSAELRSTEVQPSPGISSARARARPKVVARSGTHASPSPPAGCASEVNTKSASGRSLDLGGNGWALTDLTGDGKADLVITSVVEDLGGSKRHVALGYPDEAAELSGRTASSRWPYTCWTTTQCNVLHSAYVKRASRNCCGCSGKVIRPAWRFLSATATAWPTRNTAPVQVIP